MADFGIALAVSAAGGTRLTETGLSLGTPEYMSPEQATGERELTARSDLYSLGAVVYEMLVGEPPHTGNTVQAIIAKVVSVTPQPIQRVREAVPGNVEAAVQCALSKTPADRFASGAEFARALTDPAFTLPSVAGAAAVPLRKGPWNRLAIGMAGLAALLAVVALWGWLRPAPPIAGAPGLRLHLAPEDVRIIASLGGDPLAFSPDGQTLAFIGRGPSDEAQAVYLRGMGDFRPRKLANTDGAMSVFFSPDGEWVGFKVDRELRKIPQSGGASVLLASNARHQRGTASWGPDGAIVYASIGTAQRIEWVGENGEQMESHLPAHWGGVAQWPTYVPNGRGIIFQACESSGCIDDLGLHVLDFEKGEVRRLVDDATRGWVLPSGHLLYSRDDGAALVAPFDLKALELTGSAVPMLENVQTAIDGVGRIAVSNVGNVAYLKGSGARDNELVWVTRDGNVRPLPLDPRNVLGVRISPDGSRIAATVLNEDGRNIWIFLPDGTSEARVTYSNNDSQPVWMPGGSSIAFQTTDSSGVSINAQTVDLSSPIRPIAQFSVGSNISGLSFTPDGSRLHLALRGQNTQGFDLVFVQTDGQSDPEVFYQTTADEDYPAVSADGQLLAYISDESGEREVYVRRADGSGGREPVSSGGAQEVVWSPVGPELFYRAPDGMYSATINVKDGVQVVIRRLFDDSEFSRTFVGYGSDLSYDVDPTGENFLMIRRGAVRLHVIVSWFEELKVRVGR